MDVRSLLKDRAADRIKAVANELLLAAGVDSRCKLVIVIDQFEELLTQTSTADRARFVEALAPTLGGPIQALATLRPDFSNRSRQIRIWRNSGRGCIWCTRSQRWFW